MDPQEKAEQIIRKYGNPVTEEEYNGFVNELAEALKEASTKDTERLDFLEENNIPISLIEPLFRKGGFWFCDTKETIHDTLREAIDAEMEDAVKANSKCAEIEIKGYDEEIEKTDFVKLNGRLYKRATAKDLETNG